MNGQFDLITLISLVVAAVAILKLRNVLGQRTDEDDARVERMKTREREARAAAPEGQQGADVITLPRRDRDGGEASPPREDATADAEARIRAYPVFDASVTDGLLQVVALDKSFDPESFLHGAALAYEMIVSAFADGNKKQLKDLLTRDVYDGFVTAISEREARGEKIDQQFVGLKKTDILEAEVKSGVAMLTVRFVSELITATRDRDGELIGGDPQKIKDVTDIWTFSRDISNARALSNPNWRLMATQAPN
jgi:predicted lipid-binding transport protein (Tim44 family)